MKRKQIFNIGLVTLVLFLMFVKPWDKNYYFLVLIWIVYYLSSFVKSGIVKYYSLICILAVLVVFQESWLIDHLVPFLFILMIFADILYQIVNLLKAKIIKKFEYNLVKLLTPIFPILITVLLLSLEQNDLHEIKSNLPLIYSDLLIKCETTEECSQEGWQKKKITKGITTIQLRYLFRNNCLLVNPSKNWVKIIYYNSCNK